ncbi:hypothetical protein EV174_000309 [Coemansia sp. RSA 2320]|nr:hypothetical protein EV174_000309 [Coemansia sp. RSA 2320]
MATATAASYFSDTLHIVFSEISYYRYMFPDSFYKTVEFENASSHQLIRDKSIESDQLLDSVASTESGSNCSECFRVPLYISMRMTLTASAPANYRPPGFAPFITQNIKGYTIYPQCGSARVGKAVSGKSAMYMCALCVEGPVQVPILGSVLCSTPMTLNVDEDKNETVAAPMGLMLLGWQQGHEAPAQLQMTSPVDMAPGPQNVVHNDAGIVVEAPIVKRLALTRATVLISQGCRASNLTWLLKQVGCGMTTARLVADTMHQLKLLDIDKSDRPYKYTVKDSDEYEAVTAALFSEDTHLLWAVALKVWAASKV